MERRAKQHKWTGLRCKALGGAEMTTFKIEVSEEDRERLKLAGNHVSYEELTQKDYSLRDVARITDLAGAWVRTQLKQGKISGFKKKLGNRLIWAVKAEEVARVREEQIEKLLSRLDSVGQPKKYLYRRPTEWAYHLMVKAIKADSKLTAAQKKPMLAAMERYKARWEREYQVRLARKAAKAAEEAKK